MQFTTQPLSKRQLTKILIISMAGILTACQSTTAPVVKRSDMSYETIGLGKSKVIAQKDAISTAKRQCLMRTPIVIDDKLTYHGVLGEQADKTIDKGIAIVGAVLGTKTPTLSADDDYEYYIKFRCE